MPPELSAPSWSLKHFKVTNDAKALTQQRYLQSGDYGNGFEIYHFYRRNKIVIKCVIRATVLVSGLTNWPLPSYTYDNYILIKSSNLNFIQFERLMLLWYLNYYAGDTVGLEVSNFGRKYPMVLFSKNSRPIGTRFLHLTEPGQCLPTVSVCGNGYDVEIDIYWQTQYCMGPRFDEVGVKWMIYLDLPFIPLQ